MKAYMLILTVVLVAVLGGLYLITASEPTPSGQGSTESTPQQSAPADLGVLNKRF